MNLSELRIRTAGWNDEQTKALVLALLDRLQDAERLLHISCDEYCQYSHIRNAYAQYREKYQETA